MRLRSCCVTNVILMIFFFCRSRCRRRRLIKLPADPSTIFQFLTWTIWGKAAGTTGKNVLNWGK